MTNSESQPMLSSLRRRMTPKVAICVVGGVMAILAVRWFTAVPTTGPGVPDPIGVSPVSIANAVQIPAVMQPNWPDLMGLAVRSLDGQPDRYIARIITGFQHQQAVSSFTVRGYSRARGAGVEGRLTNIVGVLDLPMGAEVQLPVFIIDASSGIATAATEEQWHAAPPPSTFVWYPFNGRVYDRWDTSKGWEISNVRINGERLPPVAGVGARIAHLSLDHQFIAITTGSRHFPSWPSGTTVGGRTFVNFIDVVTAKRIDPVYELLDAPDIGAYGVQLTWTPDNRYLLGVHATGNPKTTYTRLWIVPFEHARTKPVGPWDHIFYVDLPPQTWNEREQKMTRTVPPESAFQRLRVPEAWRHGTDRNGVGN